jgi:hypothetical protein
LKGNGRVKTDIIKHAQGDFLVNGLATCRTLIRLECIPKATVRILIREQRGTDVIWIALPEEKGKEVTFEESGVAQNESLCRLKHL